MEWVVIQLTSYADKHVTTAELARELRRKLCVNDLELFYPSIEDVVGKHTSTFSEYLFVEYREGIDYGELEGGDFFKSVLRAAGKNKPPQILSDADIERVRNSAEREQLLQPGDRVNVLRGPLKGTVGTVQCDADGQVTLVVAMGEVDQDAVVPRHWVRPLKKRRSSSPPVGKKDSSPNPDSVVGHDVPLPVPATTDTVSPTTTPADTPGITSGGLEPGPQPSGDDSPL